MSYNDKSKVGPQASQAGSQNVGEIGIHRETHNMIPATGGQENTIQTPTGQERTIQTPTGQERTIYAPTGQEGTIGTNFGRDQKFPIMSTQFFGYNNISNLNTPFIKGATNATLTNKINAISNTKGVDTELVNDDTIYINDAFDADDNKTDAYYLSYMSLFAEIEDTNQSAKLNTLSITIPLTTGTDNLNLDNGVIIDNLYFHYKSYLNSKAGIDKYYHYLFGLNIPFLTTTLPDTDEAVLKTDSGVITGDGLPGEYLKWIKSDFVDRSVAAEDVSGIIDFGIGNKINKVTYEILKVPSTVTSLSLVQFNYSSNTLTEGASVIAGSPLKVEIFPFGAETKYPEVVTGIKYKLTTDGSGDDYRISLFYHRSKVRFTDDIYPNVSRTQSIWSNSFSRRVQESFDFEWCRYYRYNIADYDVFRSDITDGNSSIVSESDEVDRTPMNFGTRDDYSDFYTYKIETKLNIAAIIANDIENDHLPEGFLISVEAETTSGSKKEIILNTGAEGIVGRNLNSSKTVYISSLSDESLSVKDDVGNFAESNPTRLLKSDIVAWTGGSLTIEYDLSTIGANTINKTDETLIVANGMMVAKPTKVTVTGLATDDMDLTNFITDSSIIYKQNKVLGTSKQLYIIDSDYSLTITRLVGQNIFGLSYKLINHLPTTDYYQGYFAENTPQGNYDLKSIDVLTKREGYISVVVRYLEEGADTESNIYLSLVKINSFNGSIFNPTFSDSYVINMVNINNPPYSGEYQKYVTIGNTKHKDIGLSVNIKTYAGNDDLLLKDELEYTSPFYSGGILTSTSSIMLNKTYTDIDESKNFTSRATNIPLSKLNAFIPCKNQDITNDDDNDFTEAAAAAVIAGTSEFDAQYSVAYASCLPDLNAINSQAGDPYISILNVLYTYGVDQESLAYNTLPLKLKDEIGVDDVDIISKLQEGSFAGISSNYCFKDNKVYRGSNIKLIPKNSIPLFKREGTIILNPPLIAISNDGGSSIYTFTEEGFQYVTMVEDKIVSPILKSGGVFLFVCTTGIYMLENLNVTKIYKFSTSATVASIGTINYKEFLIAVYGDTTTLTDARTKEDTGNIVTFNYTTNIVNETSTPLSNGDDITFANSASDLPAGLTEGYTYYVINKTTNTFQISTRVNGDVVAFTDNGTGTTTYSIYEDTTIYQDVAIEANATQLKITTTENHNLTTGDSVTLSSMNNAGHNGVTDITVLDVTSFTCDDIEYVAGEGASSGLIESDVRISNREDVTFYSIDNKYNISELTYEGNDVLGSLDLIVDNIFNANNIYLRNNNNNLYKVIEYTSNSIMDLESAWLDMSGNTGEGFQCKNIILRFDGNNDLTFQAYSETGQLLTSAETVAANTSFSIVEIPVNVDIKSIRYEITETTTTNDTILLGVYIIGQFI